MEGSRTGVGGGASPELSMCYQCGNLCGDSETYCHGCYDLRSESDFRNEQRWRNAESDMQIVEGNLQKERATTQRLEGTLQSFRQMLMQGIHADVTIETGENDKTPAHRAVLVSFSIRAFFNPASCAGLHHRKKECCLSARQEYGLEDFARAALGRPLRWSSTLMGHVSSKCIRPRLRTSLSS